MQNKTTAAADDRIVQYSSRNIQFFLKNIVKEFRFQYIRNMRTTSLEKTDSTQKAGMDMTTGEPFKLILVYSLPIILGNIFQQLYNMCDTIIVGRLLGPDALAAVGTTGPMNFLVLGFLYGISSGCAVITAQRYGAHDEKGLKKSVAMNIMLNAGIGVIFTILSCALTMPILHAIHTPQEIIHESFSYIFVIYIGILSIVLYNSCACILQAVGDSKTPLYFLIMSSLLNIGLDIFFIIKFHWDVAGAAWATVISQLLAGLGALITIIVKYPVLHVSKDDFTWDSKFAMKHLKVGLNMGFQFSITAIGVIVLQGALNRLGAVKIASFTAAQKVEQLVTIAAGTFGVTIANYGGQNLGAGRIDRIKEGVTKACILSVGFSLIAGIIAWLFSDPLTSLFLNHNAADAAKNAEILVHSREYLHICSVFFPILFVLFVYRNVLQSIGRGFWPLMGGVFELVARTAAAYTLPLVWDFKGICAAEPLAWCAATIPLAIAYYVIMAHFTDKK